MFCRIIALRIRHEESPQATRKTQTKFLRETYCAGPLTRWSPLSRFPEPLRPIFDHVLCTNYAIVSATIPVCSFSMLGKYLCRPQVRPWVFFCPSTYDTVEKHSLSPAAP